MMKNLKFISVIVGLTLAVAANAQSQGQMRLNEYLIINTNDFQDDFGQQNSWFEIFNASYGTVDIGGCYLSDDPDNLKKYAIPGGDVLTAIPPRQHVLFWADNEPNHGTFHVNFDLKNAKEIIFTKGDGKSIIDRIVINDAYRDSSKANVSFGRLEDGIGSITGDGEGWGELNVTSPSTNNAMIDKAAKPDRMREIDPHGWIMAVTAMSVVFTALILLYLIFKQVGKFNVKRANKEKKEVKASEPAKAEAKPAVKGDVPAETYAAIVTALHLYIEDNEAHDEESDILTQVHTDRTYSPWNAKVYAIRQAPQLNKRK